MTKNCCVVQCTNNVRKNPGLSFHKFPLKNSIKKEWIRVLKMGRKPKPNTVVCGEHFKNSDYETPFLGKICDFYEFMKLRYRIGKTLQC